MNFLKKLDFRKIMGYVIYRDESFVKIKLIRDWKLLLLFSLIFFLASIFFEGYIFLNYQKNISEEIIMKQDEKSLIFKEGLFISSLSNLKNREEVFNSIKSNSEPLIKDPSR